MELCFFIEKSFFWSEGSPSPFHIMWEMEGRPKGIKEGYCNLQSLWSHSAWKATWVALFPSWKQRRGTGTFYSACRKARLVYISRRKALLAFQTDCKEVLVPQVCWVSNQRINLEEQILLRSFFTGPVEILLLWYCFWFIAWIQSIQDKWEAHSNKKMIPAVDLLSPSPLPLL